jgi:hypothetical protein
MRMMHEYCASLGLMPEASMCRKTASASSIVEGIPGRDGKEEAVEMVREPPWPRGRDRGPGRTRRPRRREGQVPREGEDEDGVLRGVGREGSGVKVAFTPGGGGIP